MLQLKISIITVTLNSPAPRPSKDLKILNLDAFKCELANFFKPFLQAKALKNRRLKDLKTREKSRPNLAFKRPEICI